MADAFKELELEDGQNTLSVGDAVANLYIVQDGQMEGGEGDGAVYFGRGDFFGELALVLDEPIDMTIKSLGTHAQTSVFPAPARARARARVSSSGSAGVPTASSLSEDELVGTQGFRSC